MTDELRALMKAQNRTNRSVRRFHSVMSETQKANEKIIKKLAKETAKRMKQDANDS